MNNRNKLLHPEEDYTLIDTISFFNLRVKEFCEEIIWLKTGSDNTTDVMHFVHSAPIGE